jgi:hypothetical protein
LRATLGTAPSFESANQIHSIMGDRNGDHPRKQQQQQYRRHQ